MASALATAPLRQHPLGFLVGKLEEGNKIALRLHIWLPTLSSSQPEFAVHDHSYELRSYVVHGSVRQSVYVAFQDPDGPFREYKVDYHGTASALVATPKTVRLKKIEEETFGMGQRYGLPPQVLHRLEPVTRSAVTLVLARELGAPPITLGPRNGPKTLNAPRMSGANGFGVDTNLRAAGGFRSLIGGDLGSAPAWKQSI